MLVPESFSVPTELETDLYRIRPLTVRDVIRDYDAVMTSVDRLQGVFGPRSSWPHAELSLEQDLIDLGWHQKEFQRRSSFAYAVTDVEDAEQLGCVYVYPSSPQAWDAEVYLWIRDRPDADALDDHLYHTVESWIAERWPFARVAFPGRSVDWEEWTAPGE